ncbi:hypothetical protein N431DRAFT_86750 [Stipitochalara longipes BDJ]|nr:hypothetical protein N431DRAFT_86750 [Stipitochalara longipes BDJ]
MSQSFAINGSFQDEIITTGYESKLPSPIHPSQSQFIEDDEDNYEFTSSLGVLLRSISSQKAREELEAEDIGRKDEQPAITRPDAEIQASQRLRGWAKHDSNQVSTEQIANRFGQKDLVPKMVEAVSVIRSAVEQNPENVGPGIKRLLEEFEDDERLCSLLATHFNCESARLFCVGRKNVESLLEDGLPIIWDEMHKYPSLRSFKAWKQNGLHPRGVHLIVIHDREAGEEGDEDKSAHEDREIEIDGKDNDGENNNGQVWCYIGSGRSPKEACSCVLFNTQTQDSEKIIRLFYTANLTNYRTTRSTGSVSGLPFMDTGTLILTELSMRSF